MSEVDEPMVDGLVGPATSQPAAARPRRARWVVPTAVVVVVAGLLVWGVVAPLVLVGFVVDTANILRDWFVWAEPIAPFSTAIVALAAGAIALVSYRQRRLADDRAEWWIRAQYAIGLAAVDANKLGRSTGMALLTDLLRDPYVRKTDVGMLRKAVDALFTETLNQIAKTKSAEAEETEEAAVEDAEAEEAGTVISPSHRFSGRFSQLLDKMGIDRGGRR